MSSWYSVDCQMSSCHSIDCQMSSRNSMDCKMSSCYSMDCQMSSSHSVDCQMSCCHSMDCQMSSSHSMDFQMSSCPAHQCEIIFKQKEMVWKHRNRVHEENVQNMYKMWDFILNKERFWMDGDRVHGWQFTYSQWNLLLDISSNYLSLQILWNIIQTKGGVLETWIYLSIFIQNCLYYSRTKKRQSPVHMGIKASYYSRYCFLFSKCCFKIRITSTFSLVLPSNIHSYFNFELCFIIVFPSLNFTQTIKWLCISACDSS